MSDSCAFVFLYGYPIKNISLIIWISVAALLALNGCIIDFDSCHASLAIGVLQTRFCCCIT